MAEINKSTNSKTYTHILKPNVWLERLLSDQYF